jgi:glycosyltransferase involved in cell wall biosynthesis
VPRLLQITDKADGGGGIRRVVDRHRRLLGERGWSIEVLRLLSGPEPRADGEPAVVLPLALRATEAAASLEVLRSAARRADIVHLHLGFSSLPSEAVAALAAEAPLVAHLHDISPFESTGLGLLGPDARPRRRDPRHWLGAWRFRARRRATWAALCRHVSVMLAPSSYLADLAVSAGLAPDRSRVLGHALDGVDPARAPPSACRPIVCFAGLISTEKGAPLLLEAFAKLRTPRARLVMLGDGPELPALRRRMRQLRLGDRVALPGAVPPHRVAEAFGSARAVAHPSLVPEGFGLVGPEALQQGRPVVGLGFGGSREWLVPGVTGLIADGPDAEALARSLDTLLGNATLADQLGESGRAFALSRFAPEPVGDTLDATLRQAIAGRTGRGAA